MTKPDVIDALKGVLWECAARPQEAVDLNVYGFLTSARGVIHVGAHVAQERDVYGYLPVAWIEAAPIVFEVLSEQIADYPNQKAFNYLVADGRTHRFGLASNACASSSIYDLRGHKELWPEIGFVSSLEAESVTLAEIVRRHELEGYDALVLDVQGSELLVLQGACLDQFQWIVAEAADFEAYAGGCQLRDLDEYLTPCGFARVAASKLISKDGVGTYYDVLYQRGAMQAVEMNGKAEVCADPGDVGNWPAEGELIGRRQSVVHFEPIEPAEEKPLRLNLGAGATHLVGFVNVDRKLGQEVYPLAYPDGSVEVIVASHILEHFGHREVSIVLQEWIRVLQPGGTIRLAVPDFEEVAELYLKGKSVNVQGYVMGGHIDGDDRHGCIFDRESLTELMIQCGLERIGSWDAEAVGCAAGSHSLNLQGFKPSGPERKLTNVRAVMSVPRFGPLMHPRCAERAFYQLGIEARSTSSCYWAQQISNLMEEAIARTDCDFVLTMDFDTIFCASDVLELYRLLQACPDVDAVIPLQSKRLVNQVLMSLAGKTPGTCRTAVSAADMERNLLPANTGHFGLTLFRADTLRKFPRPWMVAKPSPAGLWKDGETDSDINFWQRFREAGFKACLAPKVVVGHLEEVISWPGKDLKKVYQTTGDYDEFGIPAEVER